MLRRTLTCFIFLVVLNYTNCNDECNLRAIFKTPRDYDELGILERSNFEDEDNKKRDESPKSFANAQVLLKIGDPRFMSKDTSKKISEMPFNYMYPPFMNNYAPMPYAGMFYNPMMPFMPFNPYSMPPYALSNMPKDVEAKIDNYGDILKEKINDAELMEPLKVTKFEGFVRKTNEVKKDSEDDKTIILEGKNIEVLKDTEEESKMTKIHNIEHPRILPEVQLSDDEVQNTTTIEKEKENIEALKDELSFVKINLTEVEQTQPKNMSQLLQESLAKVVSTDVNFIPKLVVTYPVVKFELTPKLKENSSLADLPCEKIIRIHDEDDLFRFRTPIVLKLDQTCSCPCCQGNKPTGFKYDIDDLTTFKKSPERKTILVCSEPLTKNPLQPPYGLLQRATCERFEVIPKYDIIPKFDIKNSNGESTSTSTDNKHPPNCTCPQCKTKYTGELNSMY